MVSSAELHTPRLRQALATLTALRSAHLVPLIGAADVDGMAWLLSEHVGGASLHRSLTVATLTPVQAGYIAVQVLAGIARLHDAGLAHGRLHAGNVLVSRDGCRT
jgi:serine/threonine protein kinase